MSLVYIIIIGGIIGWIAASLMGRKEGFFGSVVIGIVGAFIGSFLSNWLGGSINSYLSFRWVGVFWSFIGALVLVAVLNLFSRNPHGDRA